MKRSITLTTIAVMIAALIIPNMATAAPEDECNDYESGSMISFYCTMTKELESMRVALELQVAELRESIKIRDQHIQRQYENIESMNNTAHQLITYNDELKAIISNLESQNNELNDKVEKKNNAIQNKNDRIEKLQEERNHYKNLAQERLDKIQNLKEERTNTNTSIQNIIDALETDPNQLISNIIQQLKNLLK